MNMSSRVREGAVGVGSALVAAYRRTGADVPFGDPVPSHGAEMEGWFWRVTDHGFGPGRHRPLRREPASRRRLGHGGRGSASRRHRALGCTG